MKIRFIRVWLGFAVCIFLFFESAYGAYFDKGVWKVSVVMAVNPKLPKIDQNELRNILKECQSLFKRWHTDIQFINKGTVSVEDLFQKYIQNNNQTSKKILVKESDLFGDENGLVEIRKQLSMEALSNIGLSSIKKSLRGHPSCSPKTLEDAFHCLKIEYLRPKDALRKLKRSSSPYFKHYSFKYDSFSYWQLLAESQKQWDIIITNQAMIFASSVLSLKSVYKGVAHGLDALMPPYSERKSLVVSTFPFYSHSSFFEEKAGFPSKKLKPHLIGEILAHELGHLLFYMPDNDDMLQPGCLMYRDWETMKDVFRHRLIYNTPPCTCELGWVTLAEAVERWKINRDPSAAESIEKVEKKYNEASWRFLLRIAFAYREINENGKALSLLKKITNLSLPAEFREMIEQDILNLQKMQDSGKAL